MNSPSSSKRKTPIKGEQVITKFFTPNSSHSRPGTLKSTSCPTHAAENRRDRHGSGGHLTAKKSHLKPESGADNHSKKSPMSSKHGHHHHHHRHHHHGHRRHRESESCSHKESSSKSAKHSEKRSRSHSRSSDRSEGQHKSSLPRHHSGSTDPGLSDNSDDDDLLKPPAALLPLSSSSEATPKPKKKPNVTSITPSANTVESENEMIDLSQSSETDQCSGVKLTITLDMLLEEKKATDLLREELEDKGEELKEFIRQGGIDNLSITTNDDDLQPQHREQIKKLEMCRKEIMHRQPGETVFHPGRFGCLFSFPETLTLTSCGFVPGSSFLDKQLATLPPDLLVQFLCSGTVQLCFHAVSCQKHFLSWTFQLLSVHRCGVEGLFSLLYDVLVMKTGKGSTWVPSVSDIIRVFVNYGATFEDLCPHPHLVSFSKDDLLSTEDKENIKEGQGDHQVVPLGAARTYGIENLQLVIQVISHALTLRPHLYTVNDLMTLTTALLKVALDISLTEGMLAFDFQVCLSAALNAFSADDWSTKAIELCYNLSSLTTHHHNRVHLVAILPPGGRGRYLQRRLAYVMLQQLVFANSRPRDLTDFKVCQLFGVMQAIVSQAHTDFYQLSSLLALINQSVGNETLKTAERDDLRQLTDMLRRMIGNVREYIHVLDRTLVKDIMVRLSNKWTFMLRDMGPKQRSLFEWTHHPSAPPQKLAVEQVQCSQDETDTEADQSEHTSVPADQSEHPIMDTDDSQCETVTKEDKSENAIMSANLSDHSGITENDKMDQSDVNIPTNEPEQSCNAGDQTLDNMPTKHSDHTSNVVDQSNHASTLINQSHHANNVANQSDHASTLNNQSDHASTTTNQSDHASTLNNQSDHASTLNNQSDHASTTTNQSDHASTTTNQSDHASKETTEPSESSHDMLMVVDD